MRPVGGILVATAALAIVACGSASEPTGTPQLTLATHVISTTGVPANASAWTLTASGSGGFTGAGTPASGGDASNGPHPVTAGVQYTLSESGGPSGYMAAGEWICTGNAGTFNSPDKVTLPAGADVLCRITNITDIPTTTFAPALNVNVGTMTKTASGLYYRDSIVGSGSAPLAGGLATVNYLGWLPTGFQFGSSALDGQSFTFTMGQGRVIPGFEEGVAGMKVGGWRKLVIPPALAYASQQNGVVPAYSILVFNVQLVSTP